MKILQFRFDQGKIDVISIDTFNEIPDHILLKEEYDIENINYVEGEKLAQKVLDWLDEVEA